MSEIDDQTIRVTGGRIKDHYGSLSFEITEGNGKGGVATFNGSKKKLIARTDLLNAFADLNVHLAALDDAFKAVGIDSESLEALKTNAITGKYCVVGVKLTGEEEDLKVSLIGDKSISVSMGRMYIETPAIPLEGSSYAHAEELAEAIDTLREELEQYKNGKYDIAEEEDEEEEVDENQLELHNEEHNEAVVTKVKKARKGGKKVDI